MRPKRSYAVKRSDDNLVNRQRIYSQGAVETDIKKLGLVKHYRKKAQELYQKGEYFESLTNLHKAVKIFNIEKLDV